MKIDERFWKCLQYGEIIYKDMKPIVESLQKSNPEFNCPGGYELGKIYNVINSNESKGFSINSYIFEHTSKKKNTTGLRAICELSKLSDVVIFEPFDEETDLVTLKVRIGKEE